MNPQKEIIDQFEQLKLKFAKFSDQWKSNSKLNVKSLIKKEYEDKTNKNYNKSRNTPMIDMKTMNDILGENLTILNEIMNEGVNIIKGRIDN